MRELEALSQQDRFWEDQEKAKDTLQEVSKLKDLVGRVGRIEGLVGDCEVSLSLGVESRDEELLLEAAQGVELVERELGAEEFRRMMSGEFDGESAFVEINGGAGGTEAQDWAYMLLRMYLRWAERKGFAVEEIDYQPGEVAGIKSAMIFVKGAFAYGHLRSEQGVHRLVRISPFDSNARRHTSFASVAVTPDIERDIEIAIDDKDLRVDTYRSSGAGGQHVNKTESAVRLTHIPTGIVVACQNERSQHKNKDRALKILKAKLFERERELQTARIDEVKGARMKIDFGSQIRSYVLQPYRLIKDLRTHFETSNVDAVLDGEIDGFIEAYLLSGDKGDV